jgi:redox-sensing transcriptional repressor
MKISNSTVRRLSIYLRQLENLMDEGKDTVSSADLAEMATVKATQLRKDLSFFGSFGVRGLGYSVPKLASRIKTILGLDREWTAVLFGAGSLGRALAGYKGFEKHNIRIVAVVDADPAKHGQKIGGLSIESPSKLKQIREKTGARIAVIAVPGASARELCDAVIEAGFTGIVNFAPVRLHLPKNVVVYSVDLAIAFEHVTYKLTDLETKGR